MGQILLAVTGNINLRPRTLMALFQLHCTVSRLNIYTWLCSMTKTKSLIFYTNLHPFSKKNSNLAAELKCIL